MADQDIRAEMKKQRGGWWFSLVMVQEAAKSVHEHDLSVLEIDTPLPGDGHLSIKVRG